MPAVTGLARWTPASPSRCRGPLLADLAISSDPLAARSTRARELHRAARNRRRNDMKRISGNVHRLIKVLVQSQWRWRSSRRAAPCRRRRSEWDARHARSRGSVLPPHRRWRLPRELSRSRRSSPPGRHLLRSPARGAGHCGACSMSVSRGGPTSSAPTLDSVSWLRPGVHADRAERPLFGGLPAAARSSARGNTWQAATATSTTRRSPCGPRSTSPG